MPHRRRAGRAPDLRVRSGAASVRVPAQSRVTVRGNSAPLQRSAGLADALRDSRVALTRVENELEALLAALRDPEARPDRVSAARLRSATAAAGAAVAALSRPER